MWKVFFPQKYAKKTKNKTFKTLLGITSSTPDSSWEKIKTQWNLFQDSSSIKSLHLCHKNRGGFFGPCSLERSLMIYRWTPLTSQHRPENDHKRQCICQIKHEKMRVVHPVFQICLFYTSQTRDSTLEPIKLHHFTKQGSTRFSFFMICAYRQNFVIKTTFKYGADHSHFLMPYLADALPFMVIFLVDVVTSEESTRIPSSHCLFVKVIY